MSFASNTAFGLHDQRRHGHDSSVPACAPITASQPGNGTYAAATPVTQSFTVNSGSQTITFDAIPNQIFGMSPFPIAAQSSALLPVTFASTTPGSCKVADDAWCSFSAPGACSIMASQAGNGNYNAAIPVTNSFNVSQAAAAGTLTPAAASPFVVGSSPLSVAVGDFNGDGKQDYAVTNFNDSTVTVLLGDGSGGFTVASGNPFSTGPATSPESVVIGDFNGDGFPDLATAESGRQQRDGAVGERLG